MFDLESVSLQEVGIPGKKAVLGNFISLDFFIQLETYNR
jgi:hypothetical protein